MPETLVQKTETESKAEDIDSTESAHYAFDRAEHDSQYASSPAIIDVGKYSYSTNVNKIEQQFISLEDASSIDCDYEDEALRYVNPITDKRLAKVFIQLAKNFRVANMQGNYTSYSAEPGVVGTSTSYGSEKIDAPWQAQRETIPFTSEDVHIMKDGSEEERISLMCDLLDPSRYRQDTDAEPDAKETQMAEYQATVELLESLETSWQKDLLAAEAFRIFSAKNVNQTELAKRAKELISIPRLRDSLTLAEELAEPQSPQDTIDRVSETSHQALLDRMDKMDINEDMRKQLQEQAIDLANEFAVTININVDNLLGILLEKGKFLPMSEIGKSGGKAPASTRKEIEQKLGIHEQDENLLDRPVYGALALGREESATGAADFVNYGNCVVKLKPEVAETRATYTYGDSLDIRLAEGQNAASPDKLMTMPDASVAKLLLDKENKDIEQDDLKYHYIEAQILGGVSIDDIQSVTIPWEEVFSHKGILTMITEKFTSISWSVSLTQEEMSGLEAEYPKHVAKAKNDGIDFVIIPTKY